jgi:cation diffusion facilitator CzcD-associated flavoprotein CzcO
VTEHVDVLIVGAGLSGIGAACRLGVEHPHRSVAVLEARAASGGTWDVFRYPGIRSDSDMFTFGFRWRPWIEDRALADGPSILRYLRSVAEEYGVDRLIRYRHRVVAASWDSATARWTVEVDHDGEQRTMTASFVWGCSGYYDTEQGYAPELPGQDAFAGDVVHPQHWPADLDYAGKRVVVIGSGATAVTLLPAMAATAEHVTMLQRSPTYVLSLPARDPIARRLSRLPTRLRYRIVRWKQILVQLGFYRLSRRRPALVKRLIRTATLKQLPPDVDVDTHFNPRYDPWDQRLCLVPDGDLFRVMRHGDASVVTGTIDTFTASGIRLTTGDELAADLVVTATGLNLKPFGGVDLQVDGEKVDVADTMAYKALMLSGVPNFAFTIGYSNASWTLKADLVADYVCRLLAHMDRHGHDSVVAQRDSSVPPEPFIPLMSGYVLRSAHLLPKQGARDPWRLRQNYLSDVRRIRTDRIDDGVLAFG